MKITRVCYNQTKRKKAQFLLAIFFLLAFAACFYITIQKPRKTVIYIDDVRDIPKGISNSVFLEPNAVKDLSFARNKEGKILFDGAEETLSNHVVEEIAGQTPRSSERQIVQSYDNVLEHDENMFKNKKYTSMNSPLLSVREGKLESQAEDTTDSLRGFLNHHVWEHVCNKQVESLREFILFPQAPSKRRALLASSFKPGEKTNNFGERIFGFISPNTSGEFQFAISSSGNSELWVSSDMTSENLRKIASVSGSRDNPVTSKPGNLSANSPSQISALFFLKENTKYFIDIIHKHQSGKAHLELAWRLPGKVEFNVITSEFLWAKMNDSYLADNTVRLADYEERQQQSRYIIPQYVPSEEIEEVLPTCPYQPSYLVKHKLVRFQVMVLILFQKWKNVKFQVCNFSENKKNHMEVPL